MAEYSIVIAPEYNFFYFKYGETQLHEFKLTPTEDISLETDTMNEINELKLFTKDAFKITVRDVINASYDTVTLYNDIWSKEKPIDVTTTALIAALKDIAKGLYNSCKHPEDIDRINEYLLSSDKLESKAFKILMYKRYVLSKIATMLYLSFTVAETTVCDADQKKKGISELANDNENLLSLLQDTTNLLVNIDVLPPVKA